jgi:cob(I)alamin adenosyltransferase
VKLYTRTGDDGSTGLFGGKRVMKDHPRVEAYGTVDEANSALGLAAAACSATEAGDDLHSWFVDIIERLQSALFEIGADLATPAHSAHESKIHRVDDSEVHGVEQWIDAVEEYNQPLKHFVLPGGSELAARLHVARATCRRAERCMVRLAHEDAVNSRAIMYINRVGDLLFAMARLANRAAEVPDIPWIPKPERTAAAAGRKKKQKKGRKKTARR